MNLCVLPSLFYSFVLIMFANASYNINDLTRNYPYCLTNAKDNRSPSAKERSDNLKKNFPFTYLDIMGNNANDGMAPRYQIKPQSWPRGMNQDARLVDRENELKSRNEGAINENVEIKEDQGVQNSVGIDNSFESSGALAASEYPAQKGFSHNNAPEMSRNVGTNTEFEIKNGLESCNEPRMNSDFDTIQNVQMPKYDVNHARVDLTQLGVHQINRASKLSMQSGNHFVQNTHNGRGGKISSVNVPKPSDTLRTSDISEIKDTLQNENQVKDFAQDDRIASENMKNMLQNANIVNDKMESANIQPVGADLLESNDVAQVLQGKPKTLTDQFLGVNDRQVLLSAENDENSPTSDIDNLNRHIKDTPITSQSKFLAKERLRKDTSRAKGIQKRAGGSPHKKSDKRLVAKGTAKKGKSPKHENPPAYTGGKATRLGKSRTLGIADNFNPKSYNSMKDVSKVQSLISDLFDGEESTNLRSGPSKSSSNVYQAAREKTEKRSADAQDLSHLGDKIYQIYQDMTELNNRAKDTARASVDHNVCVENPKGKQEPVVVEKRRKRMLLSRKKKRKHSQKEGRKNQKEELSDKIQDKKKTRKFLRKRKLKKKKQSHVTLKNIKESEQNLVEALHDPVNTARCRRGVKCKSSSLFDNMFSLPMDMYPQDGKKDAWTKKTLKTGEDNTFDLENDSIPPDMFITARSDVQLNRKALPSDIVGFINCRKTKRKSKTKQVISQDINKIDQNTRTSFMDLADANSFMNMFSGNLSVAAIKTLMNKVDDSTFPVTPVPTPSERSFQLGGQSSFVFNPDKDFGIPPALQDDLIMSATHSFNNFISLTTCAIVKGNAKSSKNQSKSESSSPMDPCLSTPFQKLNTMYPTLNPAKLPSTDTTTCATANQMRTTTCKDTPNNKQHDDSDKAKKTGESKETSKPTTSQPREQFSPPVLDGLCATYKGTPSNTWNNFSTTTKKPENPTGNGGENTGKIKPPSTLMTTCKTTISTNKLPSMKPPSFNNTAINSNCFNPAAPGDNGNNKTTAQPSNVLRNSQIQSQQLECSTLLNKNGASKIQTPGQTTPTVSPFLYDLDCTHIKDTKTTTCITQLTLRNERFNGNNMNLVLNKVKRQALPLNLLPMLLQKDIEQPIQEGQSKKIFLYLYQGNPNDVSANAPENTPQFEKFSHSQNYESLAKDGNAIKKMFSPTFEIKFSGKKFCSIPSDNDLSDIKNSRLNSSPKYGITIKCTPSPGAMSRLSKVFDKTTSENEIAKEFDTSFTINSTRPSKQFINSKTSITTKSSTKMMKYTCKTSASTGTSKSSKVSITKSSTKTTRKTTKTPGRSVFKTDKCSSPVKSTTTKKDVAVMKSNDYSSHKNLNPLGKLTMLASLDKMKTTSLTPSKVSGGNSFLFTNGLYLFNTDCPTVCPSSKETTTCISTSKYPITKSTSRSTTDKCNTMNPSKTKSNTKCTTRATSTKCITTTKITTRKPVTTSKPTSHTTNKPDCTTSKLGSITSKSASTTTCAPVSTTSKSARTTTCAPVSTTSKSARTTTCAPVSTTSKSARTTTCASVSTTSKSARTTTCAPVSTTSKSARTTTCAPVSTTSKSASTTTCEPVRTTSKSASTTTCEPVSTTSKSASTTSYKPVISSSTLTTNPMTHKNDSSPEKLTDSAFTACDPFPTSSKPKSSSECNDSDDGSGEEEASPGKSESELIQYWREVLN